MVIYSWQLTIVVWLCFVPLFLLLRQLPGDRSARGYTVGPPAGRQHARRRLRAGRRCGRRSGRTASRTAPRRASTTAIEATGGQRSAPRLKASSRSPPGSSRPGWRTPASSSSASCSAVHGQITLGKLLAFLFLVHAVRRAGADGHRDPQRGAERHRRVAPGDRHPRHPGRRGRPGRGRRAGCRAGRSPSTSTASGFAYPGGAPVLQRRRRCGSRRAPGSRSSARPARARPPSPSCSPG